MQLFGKNSKSGIKQVLFLFHIETTANCLAWFSLVQLGLAWLPLAYSICWELEKFLVSVSHNHIVIDVWNRQLDLHQGQASFTDSVANWRSQQNLRLKSRNFATVKSMFELRPKVMSWLCQRNWGYRSAITCNPGSTNHAIPRHFLASRYKAERCPLVSQIVHIYFVKILFQKTHLLTKDYSRMTSNVELIFCVFVGGDEFRETEQAVVVLVIVLDQFVHQI